MKIQSGRIRSVGINPGNGLSLGFCRGMGDGESSDGYNFNPLTDMMSTPQSTPQPSTSDSGVEAPTFASTQPVILPDGSYYYPTPKSPAKAAPTTTASSYIPLVLGAVGFLVLMKLAK